jgi:predicted nucleic acid-binding protein
LSGYLLDTNQLSIGVRLDSAVAISIAQHRRNGHRIGTCVPALCELEVGIQQVHDPVGYRPTLDVLLRHLKFGRSPCKPRICTEIYRDLRRRGRAMSQVDMMLAALCRELDLVLVTTVKDFAALPWLKREDWA